jgi:SAM-dependent methyltransferase
MSAIFVKIELTNYGLKLIENYNNMYPNNKYTKMQKSLYDSEASKWSLTNKEPVVGSFDAHDAWEDYDTFLFADINTSGKIALDFGCGPGRNIVKFNSRFKRIDGVDISQVNLDKALIWLKENNVSTPILKMNNGVDVSCIDTDNYYDVIFSTICLQHICVYDIRLSILKDFYRILKPGGSICLQMGYGYSEEKKSVPYYDNFIEASVTNGFCDVRVEDPDHIKNDLHNIGYEKFSYDLRPVGPGDNHAQWIFFRAFKP